MNVLEVIGQLINTTLVFSTALIFTALGGMYSERSGVVNIGLEGLMVSGAFAAAVATEYAIQAGLGNASPWIGFIAAAIYGVLVVASACDINDNVPCRSDRSGCRY